MPRLIHKLTLLFTFLFLFFSLTTNAAATTTITQQFKEAPQFYNSPDCPSTDQDEMEPEPEPEPDGDNTIFCSEHAVHVAMTLDAAYIRGSMAAILSVLQHTSCPQNIAFHFVASASANASLLRATISSSFPYLKFRVYTFRRLVSVGTHLHINPFSSGLPSELRSQLLGQHPTSVRPTSSPEYCNANFTSYFTPTFWSNPSLSLTFADRRPCYFNTGVMVIDLDRWREGDYTTKIEEWMELQKRMRIYELGSLPPFLLVFAGDIVPVDHKWNQHGLGGDNFRGLCRDLHPGPVSLLHWSDSICLGFLREIIKNSDSFPCFFSYGLIGLEDAGPERDLGRVLRDKNPVTSLKKPSFKDPRWIRSLHLSLSSTIEDFACGFGRLEASLLL
ncbi:hypothetical protein OIU84_015767 [Salix udensis]|uniref:Hexosyltransferase n=1 Tax=Salix udensis TaxID=889485 RepID=A0AAD6J9T7_9ROSI|nr:hypothetical protein OIU84_015767 [Salix udensis]KAJ6400185.1 hypothetical protein OIU84_015767 [Salix udensis]